MKRVIAALLTLTIAISFSGCGTGNSNNHSTSAPIETTVANEMQLNETSSAEDPAKFSLGEFQFELLEGMDVSSIGESAYLVTLVENASWAAFYAYDVSDLDGSTISTIIKLQQKTWADPDVEHNYEDEFAFSFSGFDVSFDYYIAPDESGKIMHHLVGTFTDTWYVYTYYFTSITDDDSYAYPFGQLIGGAEHSGKAARFDFTESDEQETEPPSDLGSAQNPYSAGMYKVGIDLPAGEYLFIANGSTAAYVCVSADSNQEKIIENENFEYSFFVTVSDGQYLQAKRCDFVIASNYTVNINDDGSFEDGMYRVGIDIPAGEYRLTPSGSGYYSIYGNSIAPFNIISNDNFDGNTYVTVRDGQYLLIKRCSANPS